MKNFLRIEALLLCFIIGLLVVPIYGASASRTVQCEALPLDGEMIGAADTVYEAILDEWAAERKGDNNSEVKTYRMKPHKLWSSRQVEGKSEIIDPYTPLEIRDGHYVYLILTDWKNTETGRLYRQCGEAWIVGMQKISVDMLHKAFPDVSPIPLPTPWAILD